MDKIERFYQARWAHQAHWTNPTHQAYLTLRPPQKNLVDSLTCWLVDYLNVRLLAFFVNFAIWINFSGNDKENNIIFKTIILKSYGYRL